MATSPGRAHASCRARRQLLAAGAGALLLPAAGSAAAAAAEPRPATIEATLLDGTHFDSAQLKGRVLLVNFWATWCAPCRQEMPMLQAYLARHRAQGLALLALSVDELGDEAKVREAAQPFGFAVAMHKASRLQGFGRIWRLPVSAVIDREGRLVKQDWFLGPDPQPASLDAVIAPLLAAG